MYHSFVEACASYILSARTLCALLYYEKNMLIVFTLYSLFTTKCISLYLVIPTGPSKVYFPVSCSQAQHDVMCISLHLSIPERLLKVLFISLYLTVKARLTFPWIGIINHNYIIMCIFLYFVIQVRQNVMCIFTYLPICIQS